MAVAHADSILALQENLADDEMPPEWMWPLGWEMERAIEKVIKARKEKYGTNDDDDDPDMSAWEANEMADAWKK